MSAVDLWPCMVSYTDCSLFHGQPLIEIHEMHLCQKKVKMVLDNNKVSIDRGNDATPPGNSRRHYKGLKHIGLVWGIDPCVAVLDRWTWLQ